MLIYNVVIFFPSTVDSINMEAIFVTGPVNKKTNALPNDRPLVISDRAIGIEAVEQIYIGSPTKTIASIAKMPELSPKLTNKSAGTKVAITLAKSRPTTKCREIPSKNSPYA